MLKYLFLSLALHGLLLGGVVLLSLPVVAPFGLMEGCDFVFSGSEATPDEDETGVLSLPPPDPALNVGRSADVRPAGMPRRDTISRFADADALVMAPTLLVAQIKRPLVADADSSQVLESKIPDASSNPTELLERYMPRLATIPERNLKDIAAKLRSENGVEDQTYEPRKESKDASAVDADHSVVYYRLATHDGQRYFQVLLLDRKGNYYVVEEKPQSQMDLADKAKLQFFSNPAMTSVRNLALSIVERNQNEEEKKPRRGPVPAATP